MRRKRKTATNDLTKVLLGIVLLGLIWIGVQFGVDEWIGRAIVAPLNPGQQG